MKAEAERLERVLKVNIAQGLHARVATMVVQAMQHYSCQVTVIKDGVEADARSVLGLLLLAATPGSEILVRATGSGASQAIEKLRLLIENEESEDS
jgi:phosphotransferase system HPr (HPr) family protein